MIRLSRVREAVALLRSLLNWDPHRAEVARVVHHQWLPTNLFESEQEVEVVTTTLDLVATLFFQVFLHSTVSKSRVRSLIAREQHHYRYRKRRIPSCCNQSVDEQHRRDNRQHPSRLSYVNVRRVIGSKTLVLGRPGRNHRVSFVPSVRTVMVTTSRLCWARNSGMMNRIVMRVSWRGVPESIQRWGTVGYYHHPDGM